jgi:hypothetical protein
VERRWRQLALLLLFLSLLLRLATFRDYGVTWDEQLERRNGLQTIRWYASGLTFLDSPGGSDQHLYGSLFNVLAWAASPVSPLGYYETAHLLVALFGLLATWAAARLGEDLAGPRAGFLAALALTLTPVFHGHSFNNPKDAPFAALFCLGLWAALRPSTTPRAAIAAGVLIGLAAGIRIVGLSLLVVPPLVAWWRGAAPAAVTRRAALATFAALAVALPWWPYLQSSPLAHTLDLLRHTASFGWERTVLFQGAMVPARELPRTYLPTWLLISLPEFYLLALMGIGAAVSISRGDDTRKQAASVIPFVAGAALVPVMAAIVLRPVLYDGLRQFLFVVPPLAVLAGVGLDAALRRPGPVARVAAGLAVVSMAVTAWDMARLHPYESVFFNRSSGGLPGAAGRYETDYWGNSYKEAAAWLVDSYPPGPRVRVANVSNPFFTEHYLGRPELADRFDPVKLPARADVVLAITRFGEHERWPGKVLHVVERSGVPLCHVIERDVKRGRR